MRKFAIIVLILVGAVVGLYKWSFPTGSYRYRLTIAVETDGQVHTGSSVIEVRYRFYPQFLWPLFGTNNSWLRGQAVLVDLGKRGTLIAALNSGTGRAGVSVSALELAGLAYLPALGQGNGSGIPATPKNYKALSRMRGPANLTFDNVPLFLWFSDISNPETVRMVTPPDFASVIGDQAHLVSAQVEMTNNSIVINLDKRLPWFNRLRQANGIMDLRPTGPALRAGALRVDGVFLGYTAFVANGEP